MQNDFAIALGLISLRLLSLSYFKIRVDIIFLQVDTL